MASVFPGALDNIAADKGEGTVTANDHAPHHNALADAVNAVQTALGANLSNVASASTLASHTGSNTAHGISAFGATLVDDTSANAARTTLGLGTAATAAAADFATAAQGAKADAAIPASEKGAANGVAPLDGSSKIASTYLPSFVDDVLEFANLAAFPGVGSAGVIYVTLDTNRTYRWSGSAYIEISASPGSTDAVPEGSANLYHTTARAAAAAPVQSVAGRTGTVTLAKADVGLSNVDNTSDVNKPVSTATQAALDGKAAAVHTHVKADITNFSDADYATAAQGALAATAVQPAAIANFETTTQLNSRDTANRSRANHTGTQVASTISDFATAADARITASNKVSSNPTGITGADQITNIVSLTQAEYDAIGAKDSSTFYVIV